MVERTNNSTPDDVTKVPRNRSESAPADDTGLLSTQVKSKNHSDDLIVVLSNDYENKRARQVFEWEKVRRQNVQLTV